MGKTIILILIVCMLIGDSICAPGAHLAGGANLQGGPPDGQPGGPPPPGGPRGPPPSGMPPGGFGGGDGPPTTASSG